MKKSIILTLLGLILISSTFFAMACTEEARVCADGTYVVRNSDNNCEFEECPLIKIESKLLLRNSGIALHISDEETINLSTKIVVSEKESQSYGLIQIQNERFELKNIYFDNNYTTFKADFYTNSIILGNLELTKLDVNSTITWNGTMNYQNKEFKIYSKLQLREMNKNEFEEKAKNYCENNLTENCIIYEQAIENEDVNKIQELKLQICLNNPEDIRCKQELINYCTNNQDKNAIFCNKTQIKGKVNYGLIISEVKQLAHKINANMDIDMNTAIQQTRQEFENRARSLFENMQQINKKIENTKKDLNTLMVRINARIQNRINNYDMNANANVDANVNANMNQNTNQDMNQERTQNRDPNQNSIQANANIGIQASTPMAQTTTQTNTQTNVDINDTNGGYN